MDQNIHMLTAEQYYQLYRKAFARLDDLSRLAIQAMQDLEELQLAMAEEPRPASDHVLLSILDHIPDAP